MAGFLATSKTVVAKDTYSDYYQQASVDVSVDASGKVSWKITMTNDNSKSRGRAVDLTVKIGSKTIENTGYISYSDTNDTNWKTYPTGYNTTKSGSFTLSDTSVESLEITIAICCMQYYSDSRGTKVTQTLIRDKWTEVGDGSIKVTDNFNNTFTITATKGADGENNPATGPSVLWGYNSDYNKNTGAGNGLKALTTSGTAATRRVYVKSTTTATHGADGVKTAYKDIKQYFSPKAPGKPVISYNKNRLTLREDWTFTWSPAEAINTSSPVIGYRIRVLKNGTALTGLVSGTSNKIIKGSNTNNYIDRDSTSHTIIFDPAELGFKVGDKVSVGIYAYTRYGEDNTGSQLFSSEQIISEASLVENAGVVNIKENGSFKEGQIYVKINSTWTEAEAVYTKVNGTWLESQ